MAPLSTLQGAPKGAPRGFPCLSTFPKGHPCHGSSLACPFPGSQTPPSTRRVQLQAASPQCTERIHSLSKAPTSISHPQQPQPLSPPASPTFVPGETPNPTAPRAGSPQLPQFNPLRGRRRRRIRNGFAQMCCTTPKKAEASLAEKPAPGSPGEPQTSLPTALSKNLSEGILPPHARDGSRFAPC